MRSFWSQVPLLRIAIALITGIGLEILTAPMAGNSTFGCFVACDLLVLAALLLFMIRRLSRIDLIYKFRVHNGLALMVAIASLGYLLTWLYATNNYPSYYGNFTSQQDMLLVQITEPPVVRTNTISAIGRVREVHNDSNNVCTTGSIQLNFVKDSLMQPLNYGDVIWLTAKVTEVPGPKNPYEFNFKTYQAFHNVYRQAFLRQGTWQKTDSAKGSPLFAIVYNLRDNFLHTIKKYVTNTNDLGVAAAIMLGYTDYENPDIKRAYATSGTIHVLSVSGLHVGIMFILLNFLLQWADKRGRKAQFAKAAFIILFIWFYACLTGLSPPVLRSAMMFSLMQVGTLLKRNVNMYNVLAGSAILHLLLNPFVITDLGFQLSYLAVLGLIYLQPKIAALVLIKIPAKHGPHWLWKKGLDWTWKLIAASLAAQLITLPLCVLYFYQFPNLFLISNLVVIPLSNLILFAGTALFAVSHIPYVNDVAGWLFSHLLSWLNTFIFAVDRLPFALTKGLAITSAERVLMYVLILSGCWLAEERKPKVLIAWLAVFVCLCSFASYRTFQNKYLKEVAVYDVPKQKAIAFIADKQVHYDMDSALLNNYTLMQFHIQHHWWHCGVSTQDAITSTQLDIGKLILFEGKKILVVDTTFNMNMNVSKPVHVQLLILSGNPKVSIDAINKAVSYDKLVFDSSNKPFMIKRWKAECDAQGIAYWNVNERGAFIEKWRQ